MVRSAGVTTTTVWTGFGVFVIVGVRLGGTPVGVFDLVGVIEGTGEAVHTVVEVRTVGVYVIVDVFVLVGLGPGVLVEVLVNGLVADRVAAKGMRVSEAVEVGG